MHADGRLGAEVGHLMDVVRAEVPDPAAGELGRVVPDAVVAPRHHAFRERAAHDGERARGCPVVVQGRALLGQPGQQPHLRAGEVLVQGTVEHRGGVPRREEEGPAAALAVLHQGEPAVATRRRGRPPGRPHRCAARSGRSDRGGGVERKGRTSVIEGFLGRARASSRSVSGSARGGNGEAGVRSPDRARWPSAGDPLRTDRRARLRSPRAASGSMRHYACQVDRLSRLSVSRPSSRLRRAAGRCAARGRRPRGSPRRTSGPRRPGNGTTSQ